MSLLGQFWTLYYFSTKRFRTHVPKVQKAQKAKKHNEAKTQTLQANKNKKILLKHLRGKK